MKYIKTEYLFLPFRICLISLFIGFFLSDGVLLAQDKSKKKWPDTEVAFKLATIYDDNILKYSEKYLERFRKNEDEGRFHIDTYDDIILHTSFQFTSTFLFFGKLKSKINGELSRKTYAINGIKSWNYISLGYRQYLPERVSFKVLYSYIPNFYVRHFRDEQWIDVYGYEPIVFQPYAFSKDNYGIWVQKTFLENTRIKLTLYYSQYFHNEHYTEYDSKNITYDIQMYQPIHKRIKINAGYQFITSDAKGFDASVETLESTNGPDATYEEDRFSLGLAWQMPKLYKRNQSLDAKCAFQYRYYSSLHPFEIDPLHAGRVDKNLRLYFNYKLRLSKSMRLTAYYNWYRRDSKSMAEENDTYISDEKDYSQNIFGLEFIYTIKM